MSADPEALAARYGDLATIVRRAGRAYPAAIEPRRAMRVSVADDPAALDPDLADGGAGHLAELRAAVPWMYDGPILGVRRIDAADVVLARCSYFGRVLTGDALRAETGDALRDRADLLALGDPLRRGDGRAAGVGVTTIATLRGDDGERVFVLGHRRDLPMGGDQWHAVPAGMAEPVLEPVHPVDPLAATAVRELDEELGVRVDPGALRLLGLGWDLERLVPDAVYRVDLDLDATAVLAAAPREEHHELRPIALGALDALWPEFGPERLVPPGAAALALLELDLAG